MPISRSQIPRQMYGLGSFVKSIGKTVKKVVNSPIGKAAILGFGANAMLPGGLSSLFSGGSGLAGMFGKAKNFIGGLSGMQKFGGALALGGAFGGMEDQQVEELKSNPEALANYLRQYYSNLNQNATPTQVEEFVQRNMQSNGGRISYNDGTDPKKDFLIKKGYGDMVKNMSVIEIDQLFNSVKGTTTAANTYREPAYMGGRMGYAEGSKDMILPMRKPKIEQIMSSNPGAAESGNPITRNNSVADLIDKYNTYKKAMPGVADETKTYLIEDFKQSLENSGISIKEFNMRLQEQNEMDQPIEKAYGGRINRAYGSDDLVEQASGIEGLDINVNPQGVKELDLRDSGGFIPPVGVKEKADDIPAMLSNNEFVFTADSVREFGDGDVNKGAQRMYDMMKKLENGGRV